MNSRSTKSRTARHRKMKKCAPAKASKNFEYPEKTQGTEVAAKIRKETNALTEEQRAEYFARGMQLIYGGSGSKETVRSR